MIKAVVSERYVGCVAPVAPEVSDRTPLRVGQGRIHLLRGCRYLSETLRVDEGVAPYRLSVQERSVTSQYLPTVPLTIRVETPGVTLHAPVVGSWVNSAAGTVRTPATVLNSPVDSS